MKAGGVIVISLMITFGRSEAAADFSKWRNSHHKITNGEAIDKRLEMLREHRRDLIDEQKSACSDLRQQVREQAVNNMSTVRQELADSLERAKLQAREQTRKLAEETKAVLLNRSGM